MFKIVNKQLIYRGGVDLTSQNPTTQDIQSCMAARYDAGICKHRKEHTGVIEVEKMDVKLIGNMDHTLDNTFESANRVYDTEGLSPTLNTCGGGGLQPKIVDVEKIIVDDIYNNRDARAYDEYAPTIRSERNGLKVIEATPTIKIRQATQQGFIECEVGGGRLQLPYKPGAKRKGTRQRADMSDTDNGEYP